MPDAQTGFMLARDSHASANNRIYKTTDGWDSWTTVFEGPGKLHDRHWIDEATGWLGMELGLHAAGDGGASSNGTAWTPPAGLGSHPVWSWGALSALPFLEGAFKW